MVHRALPTWGRRYDWLVANSDAPGCGVPNTLPHIFVYCTGGQRRFGSHLRSGSLKIYRSGTTFPARLILLGIAERDAEIWLVQESWWRIWRAWTLHQMWIAWTATTFGGRKHPQAAGVAQTAWHKTVQALRARWSTKKVDPVKGPPKFPKEWQKLGFATEEGGVITWHQRLSSGLLSALQRRQNASTSSSTEATLGLPSPVQI